MERNVVIIQQQLGLGDVIFGVKLARWMKKYDKNILLLNLILAGDDETFEMKEEKSRMIFKTLNFETKIIKWNTNTSNNLHVYNWFQQQRLKKVFMGPKETTIPISMKKWFPSLSIVCLTEYTCRDEQIAKQLNDNKLDIIYTGLGNYKNHQCSGIFIENYERIHPHTIETIQKQNEIQYLTIQLGDLMKRDKEGTMNFGILLELIQKAIQKYDCFCMYYWRGAPTTKQKYQEFELCQKVSQQYIKYKGYKNPCMIILGTGCAESCTMPYIHLKGINFDNLETVFKLLQDTNKGIYGCTGDQSLSDAISAGFLPLYYIELHKLDLAIELGQLVCSKDSIALSTMIGCTSNRILSMDERLQAASKPFNVNQYVDSVNKLKNYSLYQSIKSRI